jgi:hypothetical protein
MFMLFPTGLSSSPSASIDKVAALSARSGFRAPGWLAILSFALLLFSCATINNRSFDFSSVPEHSSLEKCDSQYTIDYLANHTIFVDHDGKPLRYDDGEFPYNYRYEQHLDRMFGNLAKFHERNSAVGKPTKVLIFIHGGLNSLKGTLERASDKRLIGGAHVRISNS